MKKFLLLFILIFYVSVVTAATPIYDYEYLTLEQSIDNDIVIIPTRSNYQIEYFDLNLLLYPQNSYRQETLSSQLSPTPKNQLFAWNSPQERTLSLDTTFTLHTTNKPVKITQKVNFPLDTIPLSVKEYVQSTNSIDTNDDIRELAQSLAQDVDDLFMLEHELARWVNTNIQYNLSSLTADANYPASWVLNTRYGVCDELTNLFIALNRALGIPSRFVSGIAYSDSILFDENWGNHGWAEVYFPGYGWVPYDVTYQEYGEVDATHIELHKAVDGSDPSVEYKTKGLYYNFEPTILDFSTNVKRYGPIKTPKTSLSLDIKEKSVGFGSYNLFELTIENLKDYYVVEDVRLAQAIELEYFHPLHQSVVLKPHEKKSVFWLVQTDATLDKNYIYTFPISVFATSGSQAETTFAVHSREDVFEKTYMDQFIEQTTNSSSDINLDCTYKETYLLGETIFISCSSPNELLSLCLDEQCTYNSHTANFSLETLASGINTAIIETTNEEGSRKHFFTYEIVDQAKITIPNISITQNVSFEEFATLQVTLAKNSSANPTNVTMKLTHEMLQKEWFFSFFDKERSFDIDLPAQGFVVGENAFTITVTYYDSTNQLQTIQATTTTSHAPLTTTQNIIIYYNTYAAKIIDIMNQYGMSRYYAEITAPAIIMFLVFGVVSLLKQIIRGIFRRRKIIDLEKLEKEEAKQRNKKKK